MASAADQGMAACVPHGHDDAPSALVRLAVFDYDGTMISGQSGALLSRWLIARGMLSPLRALRLGWWGARYFLHLPYRQDEAREQIFGALSDRTPQEIRRIMHEFHDTVLLKRYRQEAIDEVRRRREEGCVTLLVSATFRDIARAAARVLGVDGFVATDMEQDADGNYTGNVSGTVVAGPEKTRAVAAWADEHVGKGRWTIAYSYGDHHSDQDLMTASEKAYAVCPGKTLKHVASRRNWDVLDWK
ncbi:HAD family phosphatase [Olsenella sp. HMSC062G07]|uniref:HAD family hydrolase n=1 Tax=Olsenella sp. HMSC062G07 TaxID=1739330 RepID=UPI000A6F74A4|nr:HAD family hydrolase [Olsenella sp. HMSC062G07]